jgi:hypothetical protein
MPFLQELGQLILNYETHRPRPTKPDLTELMVDFIKEK